jgi:hypothetical protein
MPAKCLPDSAQFAKGAAPFRIKAAGFTRPFHATVPVVNPNYKKPILWSLVFALAIIASAFFFKGNPALYWIEAGLTVTALTLVILKSQRPVRIH